VAAESPAFVVGVGDSIQGMSDASAEAEWQEARRILQLYRRFPLYLAPGNHDIWSPVSERLFRQYAAHPPRYSFDYGRAHFTILDNSRSEELPVRELIFLEADLKAMPGRPVKTIVMHRPSWLVDVALRNPNFALHQLARRYGVQYVGRRTCSPTAASRTRRRDVCLHAELGRAAPVVRTLPGRLVLRHALVEVHANSIDFQIREAGPPHGRGRTTKLTDWGVAVLVSSDQRESAPAK